MPAFFLSLHFVNTLFLFLDPSGFIGVRVASFEAHLGLLRGFICLHHFDEWNHVR